MFQRCVPKIQEDAGRFHSNATALEHTKEQPFDKVANLLPVTSGFKSWKLAKTL